MVSLASPDTLKQQSQNQDIMSQKVITQNVITFGCRLNIYESEIIKNNLTAANLKNTVVFNTCAVTKEAESQAKQAIRKLRRQRPDAKIIVTGCAAQNSPEMFATMPEVDIVLGNQEKLLENYYTDLNNSNELARIQVGNIMDVKETAHHLVKAFDNHARAFLQIQNGCDHRCTFCIIPYGRGNSRSTPMGIIAEQIRHLVAQNYSEIVFTGVDLTAYGLDLPGKPTLAQMIRRILALIPELPRLRLSSIDVAEVDEELFDLMANCQRLMPHFHISLQAGDDMILKRMKRRHNRQQVIEFCQKLRALRPEVAFGADIIAGFPTETEEMFANTKDLILEADLQYLHIFPYSERSGTPASRMPQVPKSTRKERAAILRELGKKQLQKFFQQNLWHDVNLLMESNNLAHTENFIPVRITSNNIAVGQLVKARLTGIEDGYMTINNL